ncbi:MAG TPA: hypothetical protein DHU96_19235, partial [Actinobacteria bacterium]|nr:hypothetical protein [Actinomycetota bacterium]
TAVSDLEPNGFMPERNQYAWAGYPLVELVIQHGWGSQTGRMHSHSRPGNAKDARFCADRAAYPALPPSATSLRAC